jgi:hypothetical protein
MHMSDLYLLEPPTPHLLEGVNDDWYVDLPLRRHTRDFLQVDEGLPHAFSRPYINPLQHWIDMSHAGLCHSLIDSCIGYYAYDVISYCSYHIMYFSTHMLLMIDISLFWSMTKHKGKHSGTDEMSACLHWLYDYT